jgi:hypothetical protein
MTIGIQGRIEVHSWHPNPRALGQMLASDAGVKGTLLDLAHEIADEARKTLNSLGSIPPGKPIQARYPPGSPTGRYFSPQPTAVAKQISVKDQTKPFPVRAPIAGNTRITRVAIVVCDHPFSFPYQYGTMGITATQFLLAAIKTVRGRHSGTKHLRYRRPAGAP